MKAIIKVEKEVELKTVLVKAGVRYWEDGQVNGVEDTDGIIPCRDGDCWCPEIDIDNGIILNWTKGVKADVHYKVCDEGSYYLKDDGGNVVLSIEQDYVPNELIPGKYGDYIIMQIDESGVIVNWPKNPSIENFIVEE